MTTSLMSEVPVPVEPVSRTFRVSARIAESVLALWAVFVPIGIGVLLVQRDLLLRAHDDSSSLRVGDLVASDHQVDVVNHVYYGLLAASALAWMVWWVQAYRAAARRRPQRYGRGWAYGGWLVPFACLVVPKRVADDLWTAAREPNWPNDEPARGSWTVVAWWAAWLATGLLALLLVRSDSSPVSLGSNAGDIARAVVVLVAAVLAVRFAALVTAGFSAPLVSVEPGAATPIDGVVGRSPRRVRLVAFVAASVVALVALTAASRAVLGIEPHRAVTVVTADGRRYAPVAEHFSIVVPPGWVQVAPSQLPHGVVFAAVQVGDGGNTGLTVAEAPGGAALAADSLRAELSAQFHVVGPIGQTTVTLAAGAADSFAFRASYQGQVADVHVYVLRGAAYDHVIATIAGRDISDAGRHELDRMVQSFRVTSGQGA